ncbi:MAG TPA: hypothetical protein DEB06_06005 [Phycisphaerales bacterium]|nr:hypothetical protein [Phycisphaerales bacterium]
MKAPLPAISALIALRQGAMALWSAWRNPRTPLAARVLLVLGLAYLVMPLDLVSDLIPVLGWADDAMVLPLVVMAFKRLVERSNPVDAVSP